ncbi:XdhC family protein [Dyella sp. EPa41]|uniref:XdhC family protein n=1 Tax=Dyella sp. EPa41 TaxID=1561194 RepID=UPI001914F978|nr:XdhC family protein [Dyella sp. EPa41]
MNVAQEFDPLYRAAQSLSLASTTADAALATITRTRGSTFRRAGASMLVLRDGSLVCELSGGCPQRDIVWRAQQVMERGEAQLVSYGRDANYDVMLETGCGGELDVLIEPLRAKRDLRFLHAMADLRARRRPGALATVYAVDGQPLSPRPWRIVQGQGVAWSDIDDDALRVQVEAVLPSFQAGTAATSVRVISGGSDYDVLVEPLRPSQAVVVIGDGIGARMLAELSVQLGWHTTLVDPARAGDDVVGGIRCVAATARALATQVMLDAMTSAVLMTHRLERDLDYLAALLDSPVSYIGVIGSRRRAAQITAALARADERLHVPAGLDVGSETPQEIALAVAAEILALRNGKEGGLLSRSRAPIHA